MEVNDQISKYQAEFYTESAHDAYINIQRLLNNYVTEINSLENAINNEIKYRRQSKKERMKLPLAVFLGFLGVITILLTLGLLGVSGYSFYIWYTKGTLPEFVPFEIKPLILGIIAFVAFVLFLILTCKIYAGRSIVGRKLNLKKARKELKFKKETGDKLTSTLTVYPDVYEGVHRLLVRTKRNPLGKLIIDEDDKKAIDSVKSFCATSEEATTAYKLNKK